MTGDHALDWIGPAVSGVLVYDLSASVHTYSFHASTRREALEARATKTLEGYYTRSGGHILYHAVVRGVADNQNDQVLDATSRLDGGLTDAAESMAKAMDKRTRSFPTSKTGALRAWGESQLATDAVDAAERPGTRD